MEKAGRNLPKSKTLNPFLRSMPSWNALELDINAQEVARKIIVSCMKGEISIRV